MSLMAWEKDFTLRTFSWDLVWLCSFSNLFSPSNKPTAARQQNVPHVRYSSLQGADNGTSTDQATPSRSSAERSPRVVRFRDEDMYSVVISNVVNSTQLC